jgi:hypothetical protein
MLHSHFSDYTLQCYVYLKWSPRKREIDISLYRKASIIQPKEDR